MLADRSYMQDREPSRFSWLSGTVKLMIFLGIVYGLQLLAPALHFEWFFDYLVLRGSDVMHGFVWQFLTFQVLHATPMHLAFNLLALFCFGRPFEMYYGTRRMVLFFFMTGIAGGILHVLSGLFFNDWGTAVVGASAGTSGLLAAFCLLNPDGTIFLYFIPIRARYVLILSIVLSVVFMLFPGGGGVAHAAHLGGLLSGIAFMRYGLPGANWFEGLRVPLPGGVQRRKYPEAPWAAAEEPSRPPISGDFISREIDPILEKISTHGFQSLTEKEKQTLASARDRMNRR